MKREAAGALVLAVIVWSVFAAFDMDRAGLFAGLGAGALAAARFVAGTQPRLPEARVKLMTGADGRRSLVQRLETEIDLALWHQTARGHLSGRTKGGGEAVR